MDDVAKGKGRYKGGYTPIGKRPFSLRTGSEPESTVEWTLDRMYILGRLLLPSKFLGRP